MAGLSEFQIGAGEKDGTKQAPHRPRPLPTVQRVIVPKEKGKSQRSLRGKQGLVAASKLSRKLSAYIEGNARFAALNSLMAKLGVGDPRN
jgi:hypothetical protein